MPVSGNTDPAALLMNRVGPAAGPGEMPGAAPNSGGGAPPGGAMPFTGAASGGSAPPDVNPQTMMIAQAAQRLLMQQKGTEYLQKFLRQLASMAKSALSSQFMQNPKAERHIAKGMDSFNAAIEELSKNTPEGGDVIANQVAAMIKPPQGPGSPPDSPQPSPPAYPLA